MRTPRIVDLLLEINLFKGLVEGVRRLRAEGAVKTRVGKGSDDLHGERGQPPFRQLAAVAETMPALPLGVPAYSESVFINCPFDDAFRPMFDALVLAVVACGFTPSVLSYRSAVEVVASGHERGTTVQAPSRTTHGADHVDRRRA